MNIKKLFLSTTDDQGLTLVRVMLGLVMFPHGAQKVFGWFGGYGWDGTMGFFTQQMGIPAVFLQQIVLTFGRLMALTSLVSDPKSA